jgi:NifB/MoaA-like Fe-S oxidoreductase
MVRSFTNTFQRLLVRFDRRPFEFPTKVFGTVITGTLFAPVLREQIDRMNSRFGTRVHVAGIENNYFGGDVSVAGLLTGGDLVNARDRAKGNFVISPKTMLKSDEDIFLDGKTLAEVGNEIDLPITVADSNNLESVLRMSAS